MNETSATVANEKSNSNSLANPVTQNPQGTGVSNNSGALSMFAQPSSSQEGTTDPNAMAVDLDDLFHDCYFEDFTLLSTIGDVPSGTAAPSAQSAARVPSTQVPIPSPAPMNTFPQTSTPATFTNIPVMQQQQIAHNALKRKAPQSVQPTPMSVLSAPPTYTPSPMNTSTPSALYSYPGVSTGKTMPITRQLTDQQKVERRNRNREHAKRSRLRKKFLLESLQEQIHGLQSEIEDLKAVIKKEIPDKADSIMEKINGKQGQFTPLPMPSGFGPVKTLMEPDFRLMSALSGSQQNFAISDPSLPDNPIVYVSQGFLDLTGYTLDQVLGRNCRFLQGPGTDQSAVDVIRKGVREGVDTSVCLLNYKADGTPFWNQFFVAALRDAENNVVNFVGVQCEVSKAVVESQMPNKKPEDV